MNHILLVVLSASVLATVGTIFYHMVDTNYKTETAIYAQADQALSFRGVYIRDESVLTYDGDGAIRYAVADGGKIGKDEMVAEVYANESAIETKQQIASIQSELETLKRISNDGTLEQAQPAELAAKIKERYKQIAYQRDCGDLDALKASKDEFLVAMSTYQLVTSKGASDFSERIAALSQQLATLQKTEQMPSGTVTTPEAGYFVSYADGYETQLTVDGIPSLTVDTLRAVTDNRTTDSTNTIGKIVSGYGWYLAGVIDNSNLQYQVGDAVTIQLMSNSITASATVSQLLPGSNDQETIIVVYCDEMSSDFVRHRAEQVSLIKGEYEGIKVPRSAIRFRDIEETVTDEKTGEETTQVTNYRGVYVMDGEKIIFKKLDVVYEGDDYVLSSLHADDDYLILYDSIIVEGIDVNGNGF